MEVCTPESLLPVRLSSLIFTCLSLQSQVEFALCPPPLQIQESWTSLFSLSFIVRTQQQLPSSLWYQTQMQLLSAWKANTWRQGYWKESCFIRSLATGRESKLISKNQLPTIDQGARAFKGEFQRYRQVEGTTWRTAPSTLPIILK